MKSFQKLITNMKKNVGTSDNNPKIWKEKDVIDGIVVDSLVAILKTRGCSWSKKSGCSMCGYYHETGNPSLTDLKKQIEKVYDQYHNEKIIKIYTSGSFLDDKELPISLQQHIISIFSNAEKIIIESRPEYIKNLKNLSNDTRIEVAMGLESAQNQVLIYSINKGFTFEEWLNAAHKVKKMGRELKVYILIKGPFLTESDCIQDAKLSVQKICGIANTISFNPIAIHRNTVIEQLWKHGLYRPPWLWSVIDIMQYTSSNYDGLVKCDVVGGGKQRGSHNCGACDPKILEAIKKFSLQQNGKILQVQSCACKEEWLDTLEIDDFFLG